MIYHSIIFHQGQDYNDLFSGDRTPKWFNEDDCSHNRAVARHVTNFLARWDHWGESEHSPVFEEPWGSSDSCHTFPVGCGGDEGWQYTLSINMRLEYIGLTRWKKE